MFKSNNNKIIIKGQFLIYCLLLTITTLYGQKTNDHSYTRFIDSANVHINESINISQTFLDSIPKPIEEYISGRVADYYEVQALIQNDKGDYAQLYQSYIKALNYAEKEKNYRVAGVSCVELFSNIYFVKKDSTAFKYLEKAKEFYIKDNYVHGLLEIEQMYAYVKYLDHEYKNCNILILKHLDKYKKVKEDGYFYMFALYMLTENYIALEDFDKAYFYLSEFKSLKESSNIVKYNYLSFEAGINLSFAETFLKRKQLDSTLYYTEQATKLRSFMGNDLVREYYGLRAEAYKLSGKFNEVKIYLDSLNILEKKMFKNIVDASYQLNTPLLNAESRLEKESAKSFRSGFLVIFLFCLLFLLSIFYVIYNKRQKFKFEGIKEQISDFNYLKSNNEKLTGKVRGLEEYITNLKKDIKEIASINEISSQRERIKELYNTLHINSSTLLDKTESHLELVNGLNVHFFKQIKEMYPELNDSEIITCYYLFMGFKNKEIALFLNISVRALESKRYRITRKLDLNTKQTNLIQHLNETFKEIEYN